MNNTNAAMKKTNNTVRKAYLLHTQDAQKIKKAGVIFLFLMVFALPNIAKANQTNTVIGTGDPAQDVRNVQAAVDRGGTVMLRGSFDFGDEGRIIINKKATIRGETDSLGLPTTVIRGGFWVFYSKLPVPAAPPAKKGPLIDIRNIRFNRPKGAAIHIVYASGVTIRNVEVENVRPQELKRPWRESETLRFASGIVVGTRVAHPQTPVRMAVTGVVTIAGNRLHMLCDRPTMTSGHGIIADRTWGAILKIENNTVTRASRNGIEALDNDRGGNDEAGIVISGNRVVTDDEGISHPNMFTPNGIVAGWFLDTSGGTNPEKNSPVSILGNRVEIRGPSSTGLLLFADGVVAAGNDIIAAGGEKSLGIVQTGSRGLILDNRIRGHAQYAIFNVPFERLSASANTIAWNRLDEFTGYKGQILLRGGVNTVLGTALINDKGKADSHRDLQRPEVPGNELDSEDWEPVDTLP
ncbi:DUF1565 domain-containing protein [Pseudodesulfovibrio senegalensis]|uniref:DUF1565 domain-containing protein n=2 Tax=Pseudodesulfovibrio senegalensis TaxID=1721087 RepID=A0A6N6N1P2_9BACT|nr:DUF1565 domain-containing protein [Pseudodesulfovibrio senegalensis]